MTLRRERRHGNRCPDSPGARHNEVKMKKLKIAAAVILALLSVSTGLIIFNKCRQNGDAPSGDSSALSGDESGYPPDTRSPEDSSNPADDTGAPDVTSGSETTAPETSAYETSAPETSSPGTSSPETSTPETSSPGTSSPDVTEAPEETTATTSGETIPQHIHSFSSGWKTDGSAHWKECDCGEKSDPEPHRFGDWKVTAAASCTAEGEKTRVCSVCGYTEKATAEKTGHTPVTDEAVAATCTESGLTEGSHCSVCGAVIIPQQTVDALGHSFENNVCTRCGLVDEAAEDPVYVISEDTGKRGEFEKHYVLSDGSMIAVTYAESVHLRGENGEWTDADNTLTRVGEGFGNASGSILFPLASGDADFISLSGRGISLLWQLGVRDADGNRLKKTGSQGTVLNHEAKEGRIAVDDPGAFDLPALRSEVSYGSGSGGGTGLSEHFSTGVNKIEGELIIGESEKGKISSFTVEIRDIGLEPMLNTDRSVSFWDADGNELFSVKAPCLRDSAQNCSAGFDIDIETAEDGFLIIFTPDSSWLSSEKRLYPISFCTAVVNSDYHSNITDTYVKEGSTADNSPDQLLHIGVSSSKKYRAYVRIGSLPAIDTPATVDSVSLSLPLASDTGKSREVFLGKAARGWNPATVSFANQPSFTKIAGAVIGASDMVCTFDIPEGLFEDFYAGNHFGFVVYVADESKSGTVSLCSSEYRSLACRPVLTVVYRFEEGAAPSAGALPDGIYYLNNTGSGNYLYVDGTGTPSAVSGFISELGSSVRWRLTAGDGGLYAISPESAPGTYLEASDADTLRLTPGNQDGTLPASCKWKISVSAGGGVSVSCAAGSEVYYLCSWGDSLCLIPDRYTPEYEEYAHTAWRIADTGYYGNASSSSHRELPADAAFGNIEAVPGSVIPAGVVSGLSNLCWATPDDFEFSFSDWDPVIYEDGCFYLDQYGGTRVEAFHKVTGKTFEFYILSGFSTTAESTPTPAYITNGVNQAYDVWPASKESSFYEKTDTEREASLASIKLRAQITILGGILIQNEDAAAMLYHYLENTGTLYDVGMKDMLAEWDTARDYRARDIDGLMRAVEATATDSEQTICTISQISCRVSEDTNWGRAVGSYTTSLSCVYRKTSESTYEMQVTYELHDVYDWDRTNTSRGNMLVSPSEMWELHHGGAARNFEVCGVNTFTLTWNEGELLETGAVISNEN